MTFDIDRYKSALMEGVDVKDFMICEEEFHIHILAHYKGVGANILIDNPYFPEKWPDEIESAKHTNELFISTYKMSKASSN